MRSKSVCGISSRPKRKTQPQCRASVMNVSSSISGPIGVSAHSRNSTLRRHGTNPGAISTWYSSSSTTRPMAVKACNALRRLEGSSSASRTPTNPPPPAASGPKPCHAPPDGKASGLKRLAAGDWLVFYSPKTSLRDGERLQAFTAIGRVVDDELYQVEMAPGVCAMAAQR